MHILHVVGFSEGDHAAFPEEIVHSCNIVHGMLKNCLEGLPDMTMDPRVQKRKQDLIGEARVLLGALSEIGKEESADPWTDAGVLSRAIKEGLLDTPHFKGNPHLCGEISTRLIDGAWNAVDSATGRILHEAERTRTILDKIKKNQ